MVMKIGLSPAKQLELIYTKTWRIINGMKPSRRNIQILTEYRERFRRLVCEMDDLLVDFIDAKKEKCGGGEKKNGKPD